MLWSDQFLDLYRRSLAAYRGGNQDFMSHYSDTDLSFLGSIGCKPRELFDFVEDFADEGEPSESTALLTAAVRRDYFLVGQHGKPSNKEITRDELPAFGEELDGIAYLPRIIRKAEAKLRGELDPDVMYGCGGDRKFLREHGHIPPADFLRHVWAADGDHGKVAAFVREWMS